MAAKCEDDRTALSAAFAGSNACSINDRSCAGCRNVGDEVFGVDSRKSFLVENFLARLELDCKEEEVGAGGDMVFEGS